MFLSNIGKYFALMTGVSILVLTAASTFAQPKPKPLPPESQLPDSQSEFTGQVTRYLLNREGLVAGLLLDNGTQVKFPPHLSDRLLEVAQSGNKISIMGTPGVPTNFGQEVKASSITNVETGETLTEEPPLSPKPALGYKNYNSLTSTGNVEQWLVGRRGEINGMILSSGTQIKFPPHIGDRLALIAQDNSEIEVEGFGVKNDYGTVIEAKMLQVDGEPLSVTEEKP
jgi:hypothetical protein